MNNAAFDLYNEYQDTVNLKGWKASGDSFLHVDVDVENLTADTFNINGNVEGTTKLVLYPTSGKDIRGDFVCPIRKRYHRQQGFLQSLARLPKSLYV